MRKRLLALFTALLFVFGSLTISTEVKNVNIKDGTVNAKITYRSNNVTTATLQPIVVITQPEDGAVVTDPHLVVLGYAMDEAGMNYWEWEWHWQGGYTGNSSYFETAEYVNFRIDIYGLHLGWNLIIVRFKNIYGAWGEDSVNVTYNPPDTEPPEVTIDEPEDGAVLSNPDIVLRGIARDNKGITQFGYTHEWEGGSTGSSWPLEDEPVEYPFEIPVTLHEGWNKLKVEASDAAGNVGYDEVIVEYTPEAITIDLTIYNGLEGSGGGQEVPENEEESKGAFTVVNMNDSDGDGIPDYADDKVVATPVGRDEVDLSKMVLHKPTGTGVNPNDDVTLTVSGDNKDVVKLWESKTKQNEIKKSGVDKWTFKVKDLPKTVWVEIEKINPKKLKLRGITFTLQYKNAKDTVKLTGIWANVTDVKHNASDGNFPDPWGDMPAQLKDYMTKDPYKIGGFGLQRFQLKRGGNWQWWYGNVIVFQFTVYPSGIGNEEGVYFDITRQVHYRDRGFWMKDANGNEAWPTHVEQPNDDTHNDDESEKPSANDHMYVMDAPGFREDGWDGGIYYWIVSDNNFLEFMRVSFDKKPEGETVQGSRCSDYYPWHAALWLSKDRANPGCITRKQNKETHVINCVGPGFILILDFNPPWKVIDPSSIMPRC